ncbi:carbonic anhydrase family protein [Curtobacterium sp. MCPF17_002]|uniref:carbonic anhydrase n=1 Tax=Curtobacterium sp. MCPF17_002 TaxID=2175645 RepID=UPI000DA8E777|nr:carbonic anhydrase family protein [Curtobacterium sp. MCPF17_002]WIB77339.1 carbonic anhydrase family protein [Curtobacterium sp. MCPF17_002]
MFSSPRIAPRRATASLLVVPAALLVLAGCATAPASDTDSGARADRAHGDDPGSSWAYSGAEGPEHWGGLSDAFGTCSSGSEQSPVDLPAARHGSALDLTAGGPVTGQTADNGHTVQFTAEDGAETRIGGDALQLVQMHFHAGSEHTVDGEAAAAEFHFVHADAEGGLTVVGVLADRGGHNTAYDSYIAGATATADAARKSTVDVGAMLPESRSYSTYAGSLTTPPCSEGVRWIVLEDRVELGSDQLADLEAAHDHNARPVQPLGERTVTNDLR